MHTRFLVVLTCVFALGLSSLATTKKSAGKAAAGPLPDKAYLQKIWDGWGTLDPSRVEEFYAQGDHTFFDVAPLKYGSWQEYQSGVKKELSNYKSGTFTVNDDAEIQPAGNYAWGTSTVKEDATLKSGRRELATFRWTVVLEKQDGKWLIVHEHVSQPAHE
jgi:ketosteroid isomerase-like protein